MVVYESVAKQVVQALLACEKLGPSGVTVMNRDVKRKSGRP